MMAPAPAPMALRQLAQLLGHGGAIALRSSRSRPSSVPAGSAAEQSWNCRARSRCRMRGGVPGAGGAGGAELLERGAVGRARPSAPRSSRSAACWSSALRRRMRSDRSCTCADAAAEVGVAGADARRHLGQRRGGRGRPRLLAGLEGLLQQRAAIGAGLVPASARRRGTARRRCRDSAGSRRRRSP